MPEQPITTSHFIAAVASSAAEWNTWLKEKRLGLLIRAIDNLPSSFDAEKPILRSQIFRELGAWQHARDEFRNLEFMHADPSTLLRWADTAQYAGAIEEADGMVRQALDHLTSLEGLEDALRITLEIGDCELIKSIVERLQDKFSESKALRRHLIEVAALTGRYEAAANLCSGQSHLRDEETLYEALEVGLSKPFPDYEAVIQSIETLRADLKDSGRVALIRESLVRNPETALSLLQKRTLMMEEEAWLLLAAIESILTKGSGGTNIKVLLPAVQIAITYLSMHPSNFRMRNRLIHILSPEVCGLRGVALLAAIVQGSTIRKLDIVEKGQIRALSFYREIAELPLFDPASEWILSNGVMLGAKLPADLVMEPRNEVARGFVNFIANEDHDLSEDTSLLFFRGMLLLGTCLAPHTDDPNSDLIMIRQAADHLVFAGHQQMARDYVENTLHIAGDDPCRIRMCWTVMSEVYNRLGSQHEALLAMACAQATNAQVDDEEALIETFVLGRIFRQLEFFNVAREVVATMRNQIQQTTMFKLNEGRIDELLFLITAQEALRSGRSEASLLTSIEETVIYAKKVLRRNTDTVPVTAILGQMLKYAVNAEIEPPEAATILFAELVKGLTPQQATLIRAIASVNPSPAEVFELAKGSSRTRYALDVAFDSNLATIAAIQLLSSTESLSDSAITAFAIEILSDRAVADPLVQSPLAPIAGMSDYRDAATLARDISQLGINLLMGGIGADDHLITVSAENGKLASSHREPETIFSKRKFYNWSKQYPYDYGTNWKQKHFLKSTENQRVSKLPESPCVVVLTSELQQLPPNLLRAENNFAGGSVAICSAPSLSWLHAAINAPNTHAERIVAWVPADGSLGLLHEVSVGLHATWEKYSIQLHTTNEVPETMANSELVIVAAHGGLAPEGQYFHVISDEGDLTIHHTTLANALQNAGVAVLFVCSAGRLDKHPLGNTNLGIVKQLLNHGVSSVIAPPWPVDGDVIYDWLPEFLQHWQAGATVTNANHAANVLVAKKHPLNPGRYLAMNLYGNPLTTSRSRK